MNQCPKTIAAIIVLAFETQTRCENAFKGIYSDYSHGAIDK